MDDTNETELTSTVWPPIGRSRSPLTCSPRPSASTATEAQSNDRGRRKSYVVNDPEQSLDDHNTDVNISNDVNDDDDDDSEEIRALTSAAASPDNTDDSSDEMATTSGDGQPDHDYVGSPSLPPGDYQPPLSSSSASVLGRIAAGFSTAVSGGLHPLKRSTRVAPSPRSPSPNDFFWGPVMPGYPTSTPKCDEPKAGQSTMVIRQTVELQQTQTSNNNSDGDIGLRQAIPVMPMYLAVACCLLNAISPGLGTFVGGVSLAFCSRPQRENVDCVSLLLVNVWVAVFQLISSILFLIGYIWSLVWGYNFISISKEFNSKQTGGQSANRDDSVSRQDNERAADAAGRASTTTTAMTRTTTTTVSLPDDSVTVSPTVNREPPIIVLQEAPVAPRHDGLRDAAAAAVWIERQRTLHDPSRPAGQTRVTADAGTGNRSAAAMSRRQRLNRRRQLAASTAAGRRPWNDPLTGVLLCPEALEHIVVHNSIVPDPAVPSGSSVASGHTRPSK